MADIAKTNAMRMLDSAHVAHKVHTYSPEDGIDGVSVAKTLGQDPQAVFKTLVTQGKSRAHYVFVIPVCATLNLKRAAAACGEKSIEMIPQKNLFHNIARFGRTAYKFITKCVGITSPARAGGYNKYLSAHFSHLLPLQQFQDIFGDLFDCQMIFL